MFAPPVIYAIVPRYPLTDFIFEQVHELADVRIIWHSIPCRRPLRGLLRALEVYALPWWKGSFHFDRAYTAQLRRIRPEDAVLFFAIENRKDLQIIRKFIAARRQSVWLWNPVSCYRKGWLSRWWYLHWLRRSGMRAYTFDPTDAQAGGIALAQQVYRHAPPALSPAGDPPERCHDVHFVGIDKGRLTELQSLKAEFERAGLTTYFRVIADRRKRYSDAERACLTTQWLPYTEHLRTVHASRALLELLQSSQSGPTIRSMEAAFLDRKLITNNASMRLTPLYHPTRIFILGQDDLATLRDFMASPMAPLAAATLERQDILHWIRQFGH
jgi:hypothetical protein